MKKWRYLLIASILVFTLACGLVDVAKNLTGGNDEPETAVEVTADIDNDDTDVAVDEDMDSDSNNADDNGDTDSSDDEVLALDADALDMLDSYRVRIYWKVDYADDTGETLDMEMSVTRDPEAYQYVMGMDGDEMEMIQIEDTMWIRFGDEWIASTTDEMGSEDFSDFLISDADMDMGSWSKDDYTYIGKETINGIKTRHYQAEYNEFWGGIMAQEDVETVDDATADFWVADDKNLPSFVVKMTMTVTGTFGEQDGEWTIEQEVYDINESFTIEAPEGVTAGFPEDVPAYPGAEEFASFGGMITFSTVDTVEDVAEFYSNGLDDAGWTQDETNEFGTMIMATYSKFDQSLTLTITSDEDAGTSVLMMIE